MNDNVKYDVAIIGGGLAGLALGIQSAKAGYKTALFEKEKYPFHKVCGEYISFESWNFLEDLGVPLSQMNLPVIRKFVCSAPNGKILEAALPLGGFGISRFMLDNLLAEIAKENGVVLYEETKAEQVIFENNQFTVLAQGKNIQAKIVAGTFGKRSNLDIKWKRNFTLEKKNKLNNYIAVKYHVKTNWPEDVIALHNFNNGYCGISKIEDNKYCLCYLTTARNLEQNDNSIPRLEQNVLSKNPHLKNLLASAELLYATPLTISQISFSRKTQVEDHVLMIGDAAGMITPLCGNGMSMALHGSKLAFNQIGLFLQNKINRQEMEQQYALSWKKHFSRRLFTGRAVQGLFGHPFLTNSFISLMKTSPSLTRKLISQTHGQPF